MIVYVESNFVLELTLLQEQHVSCNRIVALARDRIRLVVPAYSFIEPYETLTRFSKSRQSLAESVRAELRQLGRSAPYAESASTLEELTALFVKSQEEERSRLRDVTHRMLDVAEVIALTENIVADSHEYQREGFSPQDAVVYASVLRHLASVEDAETVFLNRNSKDFDDPDVQEQLEGLGCKILFQFDDGVRYVQHRLRQSED